MDPRDFYLLQDGTQADPSDVERDAKGILRHKNGLAVCLDDNGNPQTIGRNAEVAGNVSAANAGKESAEKPGETAAKPAPDIMKLGESKPVIPARETKAG